MFESFYLKLKNTLLMHLLHSVRSSKMFAVFSTGGTLWRPFRVTAGFAAGGFPLPKGPVTAASNRRVVLEGFRFFFVAAVDYSQLCVPEEF